MPSARAATAAKVKARLLAKHPQRVLEILNEPFHCRPARGRPAFAYGRSGTVTNFAGDMPSASAWKFTTTRWLSTGTAIAFTSSKSGTARAVHRRARLGAEDEVLRRARAGAPAHVLLHERRRLLGVGPRRPRQLHRVAHDGRRRRQPAHEMLQRRSAARALSTGLIVDLDDRPSSRRRCAPPRRASDSRP